MSRKFIITGATSIIGQSLLTLLKDNSEEIIFVSRKVPNQGSDQPSRESNIIYRQWDLATESMSDSGLVNNMSANKKSEYNLIHCAPIWLLNEHVGELAAYGIKRVIAFSSSSIIGKSQTNSEKEKQIVELLETAESVLNNESTKGALNVTIFRPTMIYGHGQGMNLAFIAKMITRFGFFPVVTGGTGLRSPVHANDLAQAVCLAVSKEDTYDKTYVLSGQQEMTYIEMVGKIFQALGKPVRIVQTPLFLFRWIIQIVGKLTKLPVDPEMAERMRQDLNFDSLDAKQDFAYSPGPFLPNGSEDILPQQSENLTQ